MVSIAVIGFLLELARWDFITLVWFNMPKQVGELCHAKALFHSQASEQSLTRFGVCRRISLDRKRCVRLNQRSVSECTIALAEARNLSCRGGNFRRQLGDVPCLRQGKCRTTTALPKTKAGCRMRCRLWLRRR